MLFFKLRRNISAYGCQTLASFVKSAVEYFEEKYYFRETCISSWFLGIEQKTFCPCFRFFSELSNLHSTCPAKSFPKFFSNEITFFIFFGWTLSTKFVDVCQTLSGRTVRAAFFVSIGTKKRILYFFSKSFCFLSFSDNEQKKSVSASQILVFLSKMLSMCPQEPLEEKTILIRKNYSFVNLGHWAQKLWLLSENLVRVCQNCIQRSLWNFSGKSLIWIFFIFAHFAKLFRHSAKKVAESSKMQSAYQEKHLASCFWEKCFLIVSGHWVKILQSFVKQFFVRFSKVQSSDTDDHLGENVFSGKTIFFVHFRTLREHFLVFWKNFLSQLWKLHSTCY